MAIKAITLDIGHTLLFPEPSLGQVYAQVAARHGLQVTAGDIQDAFQREWEACRQCHSGLLYGTSHAEALAFWRAVNRRIFPIGALGDDALARFVADLYVTFGDPACWRVNHGLERLLDVSRRHGIRVGIISNWDLRLRPLIEALGFTAWADPVLISAEVALEKPDRALFEMAIRAIGLPPPQILHVGDTWRDDVVAARACGMQAAWYNPGGAAMPDDAPGALSIRELDDLQPFLAPGTATGLNLAAIGGIP